ncbi:MAG: DUF86 domain-containing protein [Hormoscilla sp. SP5CHS1]|nr:DUF86 domain-containing protein [Hormoscilla sp. SP5CHS1]
MSRDNQTIRDLVKAAALIVEFKEGIDKATFLKDLKTQSAILYQFAILGEAVKRLSWSFREQHEEIPWSSIAGMRDKLIHDYDGVNLERVWKTASENLPEFLAMIEPLLTVEEEE